MVRPILPAALSSHKLPAHPRETHRRDDHEGRGEVDGERREQDGAGHSSTRPATTTRAITVGTHSSALSTAPTIQRGPTRATRTRAGDAPTARA